MTAVKVFFPDEPPIQVHQLRVCACPPNLPAGFYWYGGRRKSAGTIPRWLQKRFNLNDELSGEESPPGHPDTAELPE